MYVIDSSSADEVPLYAEGVAGNDVPLLKSRVPGRASHADFTKDCAE